MESSAIYTNGPGRDHVLTPYDALMRKSSVIRLAAPYFTRAQEIVQAARRGAEIHLLVGLNSATNPSELAKVLAANCHVQYFTDGLHAKVFLFDDDVAMIGSANLTDGGLINNREATVVLDQPHDGDRIRAAQMLFASLWVDAAVLTPAVLARFRTAWDRARRLPSVSAVIEQDLTEMSPSNVLDSAARQAPERLFLADMQKQIYMEYKPAFDEVAAALEGGGHRRADLAEVSLAAETNRFLNWVRLTKITDDAEWMGATVASEAVRRARLESLGAEWRIVDDARIHPDYAESQHKLHAVFGSVDAIDRSSKETIMGALMSVHAFYEQLRFVKGGHAALGPEFWRLNNDDLQRVRNSLSQLLHGRKDFAERICEMLWSDRLRLAKFGKFSSLELVGLIHPEQAPPINQRMAKALRFLGFGVKV